MNRWWSMAKRILFEIGLLWYILLMMAFYLIFLVFAPALGILKLLGAF